MALYAISPGDKITLKFVSSYLAQTILYNFSFNAGTVPAGSDGPACVRDLASTFKNNIWNSILQAACNPAFHFLYIQGQVVYPTPRVYERVIVAEDGTYSTSTDLPANVAATISRSGTQAGRGKNSSLHLSGLAAEMLSGGNWTGAAVTLFNAVANIMPMDQVGTLYANTYNPIIWTKADLASNNVIRSAEANNVPRTMHRRTQGLGV